MSNLALLNQIFPPHKQIPSPDPEFLTNRFIDLFLDFAGKAPLSEIAAVCRQFCLQYPEAKSYFAKKLPSVIVRGYLANHPQFRSYQFARWSRLNPKWADSLRQNADNPQNLIRITQEILNQSRYLPTGPISTLKDQDDLAIGKIEKT